MSRILPVLALAACMPDTPLTRDTDVPVDPGTDTSDPDSGGGGGNGSGGVDTGGDSGDGTYALPRAPWFFYRDRNSVFATEGYLADLATGRVRSMAAGAPERRDVANYVLSADRTQIAYGRWVVDGSRYELAVDSLVEASAPRVLSDPGRYTSTTFAWSADGTRVAYVEEQTNAVPGRTMLVSVDGSSRLELAAAGRSVDFSSDGAWLAWTERDGKGGSWVWVSAADGSDPRRLEVGDAPFDLHDGRLIFLAGTTLLVLTEGGTPLDNRQLLWDVAADEAPFELVSDHPISPFHGLPTSAPDPTVAAGADLLTPDGAILLAERDPTYRRELYKIALDGTGRVPVGANRTEDETVIDHRVEPDGVVVVHRRDATLGQDAYELFGPADLASPRLHVDQPQLRELDLALEHDEALLHVGPASGPLSDCTVVHVTQPAWSVPLADGEACLGAALLPAPGARDAVVAWIRGTQGSTLERVSPSGSHARRVLFTVGPEVTEAEVGVQAGVGGQRVLVRWARPWRGSTSLNQVATFELGPAGPAVGRLLVVGGGWDPQRSRVMLVPPELGTGAGAPTGVTGLFEADHAPISGPGAAFTEEVALLFAPPTVRVESAEERWTTRQVPEDPAAPVVLTTSGGDPDPLRGTYTLTLDPVTGVVSGTFERKGSLWNVTFRRACPEAPGVFEGCP